MRFSYSPETGHLSVFATAQEFHLTADVITDHPKTKEKEYRVVVVKLKNKDGTNNEQAIQEFIEDFTKKMLAPLLGDLYPDEKIKDIVIYSTIRELGFIWTSLMDRNSYASSHNFLDMILSYGTKIVTETAVEKKNIETKELMEVLSEEDFAKLTLAKVILGSIEHPSVWKKKGQTNRARTELESQLNAAEKQIAKYEKKYGFTSEEMLKYYRDDEFPEPETARWLQLTEDVQKLRLALEKYALVEDLVAQWRRSFDE